MRIAVPIAMFALLGAHGAGLLHALNTVHEACAEHGELIHTAGNATPLGDAHHADAPSPASPEHEDSEENHEHCELLAGLDTVQASVAPTTSGAQHAAPAPDTMSSGPRTHHVLAEAPKTSPPRTPSA